MGFHAAVGCGPYAVGSALDARVAPSGAASIRVTNVGDAPEDAEWGDLVDRQGRVYRSVYHRSHRWEVM
jgi:hypothetical protein